ncbi:MAG: hypothetical protein ACRCYY_19815 [Trueperaceae bacterium]
MKAAKPTAPATKVVSEEVFRQVYESPQALPGKECWVTSSEDVREIERLLGMERKTIGAPLWVSGDSRHCHKCQRETSWLDIVASALSQVHRKELLVRVILGDKKYVNTEAPRAIEGVVCYTCQTPILDLRSFKCHNWAYAKPALLEVLERVKRHELS